MAHIEFKNMNGNAEALTPISDTNGAKCLLCDDKFSLVHRAGYRFLRHKRNPHCNYPKNTKIRDNDGAIVS